MNPRALLRGSFGVLDDARPGPRLAARGAVAVVMAAATVAVTHALIPWTGRPFFFAAFPLVMLSALVAGARAGVGTTLLVTAAYASVYFEPVSSILLASPEDAARLAGFAASASLVAAACGALRRAYRRERALRAEADAAAAALRAQGAHLDLALRAGRMLAWTADAATGAVDVRGDFAGIYGRPPPAGEAEAFSLLHPEDVARHRAVVDAAVRERRAYESDFRVLGPDGSELWIHERAGCEDGPGGPQLHGVSVDVTRMKRAELSLGEEARRKDAFLATLGHELRNPLAPMRNALAILESPAATGEQVRRARAVLGRQLEQVTRLVDDLLDVSRVASGKIRLDPAPLDLAACVLRTVEDHRPLLAGRGLRLEVTGADAPVWIHGDATRLSQLLGNLLQNAAKFTDPGGEVDVALTSRGDEVELAVSDDGVGLDPGVLPRLFTPFAQADPGSARSSGGLGLGLSLVKGIAELHGGRVRAESAGPGHGARFAVTLPRGAPPAEAAAAAPPPAPSGRRRVLVVDDNADAASTLAEFIALLGHQAEVATDGRSAIARARADPPDLVLCDIGLPDISGLDVARALREDPALRATRLVALTGFAQPRDRERAVDAGFTHHLAKPLDPAVIADVVEGRGAFAPADAPPRRAG